MPEIDFQDTDAFPVEMAISSQEKASRLCSLLSAPYPRTQVNSHHSLWSVLNSR
jgi:hypothetical protein